MRVNRVKRDNDLAIKRTFTPKNPVHFKSVKADEETGDLIIEGFANRFQKDGEVIIDRGGDVIPPEEWNLKEFMENPIIFFNHNRDLPIGRALEASVSEDGLFIKALISKSTDPETTRIRTLIEEGILKSFSVGIDVEEEISGDKGESILKGVKLLENSVVSIPMNQGSFFSISNKAWEATHKLCNFDVVLQEKGAWVAAAVHNRIFEMAKESDNFDRSEALTAIAESAGIPLEELFEVLAGNVVDVPMEVLDGFSTNLNLDREDLERLNDGDAEVFGTMIGEEADDEEDESEEEVDEEIEDNDEATDDAETVEEEDDDVELADEEGEEDPGESEGDDSQLPEEETDTAEDEEDPEDDEEEDEKSLLVDDDKILLKQDTNTQSFRACVAKKIREAIEAGKDQDEATAFALNACRDEKNQCVLTSKELNELYLEAADSIELKTTGPLGTMVESDADFGGNQVLAAQNQTNVLLGQVIAELQKLQQMAATQQQLQQFMNAAQQALASQNTGMGNPPSMNDEGQNMPKHLDSIRKYQEKLMQLLSEPKNV